MRLFRANVIRMEESVLVNEKRLQEKMHECAQLGGELDRSRDEAARALQRANDRQETIKKSEFMLSLLLFCRSSDKALCSIIQKLNRCRDIKLNFPQS